MIKIKYKELKNYLCDDNQYQLRNAITEDDIVYPVETYRAPDTDEYIIYIRHKLDHEMFIFYVHCYTEPFAKECYDYMKSVLVRENNPEGVVTLSTYSDFFLRYLNKYGANILDFDCWPSMVAYDCDCDVPLPKNASEITVKRADKEKDHELIHEFKAKDPSPRNDIEYYIPTLDIDDPRCAMFIALKDGHIVGYLISAPYTNGEYVEVQDIYVASDERGKHYATILSARYKEYILKQGYKPLYSDADNSVSAKVALKSGFKYDHVRFCTKVQF